MSIWKQSLGQSLKDLTVTALKMTEPWYHTYFYPYPHLLSGTIPFTIKGMCH